MLMKCMFFTVVCAACMLLLLSRFSHVRLCETPYTAAHQAPPSLGVSRQEHWSASGLRWVWRNGRGPHLEGRQAPQASSAFRTPTAGSLQSCPGAAREAP